MKIIVHGNEMIIDDAVAYAAYFEVAHRFDMEEVENILEFVLDDLEIDEREKVLNNKELISQIASRYRNYMDCQESGDMEYECARDAYEKTMQEIRERR